MTSRDKAITAVADVMWPDKTTIGRHATELQAGMVLDAAHRAGHIHYSDECRPSRVAAAAMEPTSPNNDSTNNSP